MMVRCDSMRTLGDYADALQRLLKTKPWRGYSEAEARPLDSRKKHHMTICKGSQDEIRCKLYRTDVVTYWPDGRIEVRPYGSNSTNAFANALLPRGVRADFHKPMLMLNSSGWDVSPNSRAYRCPDNFTIVKNDDGLWMPTPEQKITPWDKPRINREKAKAALKKYNFADLEAWVMGVDGLRVMDLTVGVNVQSLSHYQIPEFMAGGPAIWKGYQWRGDRQAGWGTSSWAINRMPVEQRTTLTRQIEHVRMCIYKLEGCIEINELPYLTSYKQVHSLRTNKLNVWS